MKLFPPLFLLTGNDKDSLLSDVSIDLASGHAKDINLLLFDFDISPANGIDPANSIGLIDSNSSTNGIDLANGIYFTDGIDCADGIGFGNVVLEIIGLKTTGLGKNQIASLKNEKNAINVVT